MELNGAQSFARIYSIDLVRENLIVGIKRFYWRNPHHRRSRTQPNEIALMCDDVLGNDALILAEIQVLICWIRQSENISAEDGRGALCEEPRRSEEHTSELQSLMRISYAVFCLKKK